MSLSIASTLTGLVLLIFAYAFCKSKDGSYSKQLHLLRNKRFDWLCFGAAAASFLYQISELGPADFGQYKGILLILFGAAGIGAFFVLPDFLGVRGLAVLVLLSARPVLDAAYMQPSPTRLFLVSIAYLAVILAIWTGVQPYRARDFLEFLKGHPKAARMTHWLCVALGAGCIAAVASY